MQQSFLISWGSQGPRPQVQVPVTALLPPGPHPPFHRTSNQGNRSARFFPASRSSARRCHRLSRLWSTVCKGLVFHARVWCSMQGFSAPCKGLVFHARVWCSMPRRRRARTMCGKAADLQGGTTSPGRKAAALERRGRRKARRQGKGAGSRKGRQETRRRQQGTTWEPQEFMAACRAGCAKPTFQSRHRGEQYQGWHEGMKAERVSQCVTSHAQGSP